MQRIPRGMIARLTTYGTGGVFALVLAVSAHTGIAAAQTAAQPSTQAPSTVTLDVDSPDATLNIVNGQRVFVGGWAVAGGATDAGISSVEIYLDSPQGTGNMVGSARLGITRQDVASTFGHPEWRTSGYNFDWIPRNIAAGPHTIYIVAHAANGQSSTSSVPVSACGCGFIPSVTNPGVTRLGTVGYELDTGGPGVLIERLSDDPPTGQ